MPNPRITRRLGVDIGGTFTDAVLEVGQERYTAKTLTTPHEPDEGVIQCMQKVLQSAQLSFSDLDLVVHGTTLATNALIERKGASIAMLTTDGFRDVVEIGLEYRYDLFDLFIEFPSPIVSRNLRFQVKERIGAGGRVLLPLDEEGVQEIIEQLRREKVEAIAICFMHSYSNPEHEQRVRDLILAALPDVQVTLSSEVAPEMREFERFCTACANAYVQPKMESYLDRLDTRLTGLGMQAPLLLMLSGGGLTTVATARKFPVRLVESGPAGGAVFAAAVAEANGLKDVVSFDMGGTTAKICLIDNGKPQTSRTFEVARMYRFKKGSGMPVRIPVIDMVEIGSGGGSIAHLDSLGRLAVGPESAGSEPGPVCFGRGGKSPAVTDGNLVTGKINPKGFGNGMFALDNPGAVTAIQTHIGDPLKLGSTEAAAAIIEVVDENMASAARVHAVESGKEISDRVLIAFGGGAPLHAASIMRKLGMRKFLVPESAGVGSAVGFLRAPVSYEIVRSHQQRLQAMDIVATNAILDAMAAEATGFVEPAAAGQALSLFRTASMRYVGQGHEINVKIPSHSLGAADIQVIEDNFNRLYRAVYQRTVPNAEIEVLAWSVLVSAASPAAPTTAAAPAPFQAKASETRKVFDERTFALVDHDIYWRSDLKPGAVLDGPAIIEEEETSTLISAGIRATVLATGAIFGEERRGN